MPFKSRSLRSLLLLIFTAFLAKSAVATTLSIYPVQAAIYAPSTSYTLTVNGQTVPVTGFRGYDIAQFAMGGGSATIQVTKIDNASIGGYTLSPKKLGISPTLSGASMTFTISTNHYLILKLDSEATLMLAIDPLESSVPASSGTGIFNVTAAPYNAISSTTTYATNGFVNALSDASAWGTAQGGGAQGTVYVPAGIWTVGNLVLNSNVALYLAPGAVLRFTGDVAHYTQNWHKASQNRYLSWFVSTAYHSSNIKVYGRGTIDGNGKQSLTVSNLGVNLLVPVLVSNFSLDGITFKEASGWAIMPTRDWIASFTNYKVFDTFDLGEDDGIDVMESTHVTVDNAMSIGLDDNYSTKTWSATTDLFATSNIPDSPRPLSDVNFSNLMAWTYCYAFKIGQGVEQPTSAVTFNNGVVYDAAVGIGIDHKYGTATASNILFENIDVEQITYSNSGNETWIALFAESPAGSDPVDGVKVSKVKVWKTGSGAGRITGLDGSPINNVTLDSITMLGSTSYATSLSQMNITNVSDTGTITITP